MTEAELAAQASTKAADEAKAKADADAKAKADAEAAKGGDSGGKPVVVAGDLKLPDGALLDAEAVERIASFAKERGLTKEQAQAILERDNTTLAAQKKAQDEQLAKEQAAWVDAGKKDKEIGGEDYPKKAELAKRVIDKFGTPEFKQALNVTGLGDHPELLRVFVRIGKAMADDTFIHPSGATGKPKSIEERLYPNS